MKKVQDIQFTKDPYIEDVGPRKIKNMKFGTFSGSEIQKAAEVQVWKGQYYDPTRRPIENGLLDPHMGPANKSCVCATCHGGYQDCPGHFGYLKLALPTFHEGFMGTIINILKCICKSCAHILMEEKEREETLKKMRNPKLDYQRKETILKDIIKKKNKVITCRRCGYENGTITKSIGKFGILYKGPDAFHKERAAAISHTKESKTAVKTDCLINPAKIYSLFCKMLDEDYELLNLCDRPEKLLITNIPVPPIAIRPSVIVDGSQSNENDITERLKRIIEANTGLLKELEEPSPTDSCLDIWEQLQCDVAYYINSDVRGFHAKYVGERPLAGFSQRLKGKNGRFRGNLSGKRVEYTGRTVISPDPNLKITQVAIPIHMARILTYPERVSHHNIEKLRQCVRNGPNKYPGARMVRHPDGEMRHLMFSARKRIADELKYGYIVDRHLEDGDIVLFNRQPSLHRMSIMCHRARIMPWRTLRFNESVCNPYNADFDGDEMNMHVPQTEEARTEALMLMGVQNNLCTPKNGEVLVASTQDFLTSSFLITRKDTFYDRANFALICSYMGDAMDTIDLPTPAIFKPIELWTGKQLFSVLVRPNAEMRVFLNFTVREKNYTKSDPKKGTREFESMCPSDGFVYFRNSELISGQLGKATLGNGNKDGLYSVLLRDYNAHAAATCMNRLAKLSARWIGNHGFSIGIDDVQPEKLLNEKKEVTIEGYYKKCDDVIQMYNAGKLKRAAGCDEAQTLEAEVTQHLNAIREATAKVCMGELHWRNSPLIMSQCGSKGSPINISQMIACVGQQSVGGRRAPDGFIDRSLPHFPRNSKSPAAKGFVANSFYSGLTATEFFFHTMGGREGLVDTAVKTADTGYMSRRLMKVLEDLFIHYDTTVRNASGCIVQFRYGDDGMDPAYMEGKDGVPLDFGRMLLKVKAICPVGGKEYLSPKEISVAVERRLAENDRSPDGPCSEKFKNSLRKALSLPEKVAGQDYMVALEKVPHQIQKITENQLKVLLDICISRYNVKKIEAGTAIGAIGAQSIGEPGTQMTLKTFHFAGVASMNVTLGVPRIKEIINAAKNISTPIITVNLERDDDKGIAQKIKGRIEKTNLGQIAESVELAITTRSASICINLAMRDIQDLGLCIDANIVKESILKHAKKFPMIQRKGKERPQRIKLDQKDIRVLNERELEIIPSNFNNRDELLFALQSLKNMLPFVVVTGINTAERAVVNSTKKKDKDGQERERYTILVEGTGLLSVMGTIGVDGNNTWSNHVMEVYQTIGIEAARRLIIDEIDKVMKGYGMSIDIRHMFLLADVMTVRGEVLGITRFGIAKMDKSVLMQASFERQSDHLFSASVSGKDDRIEGVSECIIMGVPVPIGTGILKVRQRDNVSHRGSSRDKEILAKKYDAELYEIQPILSY